MISGVLGALIGLFSSILPEVLEYFNSKERNKHDQKMYQLNIERDKAKSRQAIDRIDAQAYADEGESLRQHDSSLDGGKFINALRASVRPVITYFFFFVFVAVKAVLIYHGIIIPTGGLETQLAITEIMPIVWDDNVQAIFGAIMGFWFGDRAILRRKRQRVSNVSQQSRKP